jgi:hypothetical protein
MLPITRKRESEKVKIAGDESNKFKSTLQSEEM